MLAKIFASSMVVLILLPFTAPFSTCDLAAPIGHIRDHRTSLMPRAMTARRGRTRRSPTRADGTRTPLAARDAAAVISPDDRGHGGPSDAASLGNVSALVPARVLTVRTRLGALAGPRLAYTPAPLPARDTANADSRTPSQRLGALLTILRL